MSRGYEPIGGCSETARVGLQYAHRKRREAEDAQPKEDFESFLARIRAEIDSKPAKTFHVRWRYLDPVIHIVRTGTLKVEALTAEEAVKKFTEWYPDCTVESTSE